MPTIRSRPNARKLPRPPRILVLTMKADAVTLFRAGYAYIAGMVWKTSQVQETLRCAVREILAGRRYFLKTCARRCAPPVRIGCLLQDPIRTRTVDAPSPLPGPHRSANRRAERFVSGDRQIPQTAHHDQMDLHRPPTWSGGPPRRIRRLLTARPGPTLTSERCSPIRKTVVALETQAIPTSKIRSVPKLTF